MILALEQLELHLWRATLAEGRAVLKTSQLQANWRFRRAVKEQLGVDLPPRKTADWCRELNAAMAPLREERRRRRA